MGCCLFISGSYSVGSLGWESWWQRKNLVVWAVDADGIFVGNVPVRYEDGCACITLGKKIALHLLSDPGRINGRNIDIFLLLGYSVNIIFPKGQKRRMKMKKLIALFCAALMVLSLAACGTAEEAGETKVYNIGICQLVQHEALDAATAGFKQALVDEFGENVKFDEQNAAGDSNTCSTIVNTFVSNEVDLILANATPALQAAATAILDTPVLGTSITEYGVALGIEDFNGTVGGNISGTSDLAPLDKQADMIKAWVPEAQTVGLLFCSAEANSKYQVEQVEKYLTEAGLTCNRYPFADSNDMAAVVEEAAAACDVIYVPTDNACANGAGIIDGICRPAGVPVITGESGPCGVCGIATLSINYYDLGYATGLMAVKILKGEAKISEMPIEYTPEEKLSPLYNAEICAELGITPLEGYEPLN